MSLLEKKGKSPRTNTDKISHRKLSTKASILVSKSEKVVSKKDVSGPPKAVKLSDELSELKPPIKSAIQKLGTIIVQKAAANAQREISRLEDKAKTKKDSEEKDKK